MGCLYRIDFPNGKAYIGITMKTAEQRFKAHCKKKSQRSALGAALVKYGIGAARITTLAIADSWPYLCDIEKRAIKAFQTKSPLGYNLTEGGDGVVDPSEEIRAIKSEKHKQYFAQPGIREAHSAIKQRHGADPVVRSNMSKAAKAYYADPEARRRNAERQKVTHNTPEALAKHRAITIQHNAEHPEKIAQQKETLRMHYADTENRKAASDRMNAFYQTEAGKAAIESMRSKKRGAKASCETRAKMSVSRTGHKHTAESKAKMSAALRAAWSRRKAGADDSA